MARNPSHKEKMAELLELRYLLLTEGLTQAQAARQLGRAAKTINEWVELTGMREELRKKRGKRISARELRLDKSLPPFVAFLRIHYPALHRQLQPALEHFPKHS